MKLKYSMPRTQAKIFELIKPVPTDWNKFANEMILFSGGLELELQELKKKYDKLNTK
jgi:hypothetical protein